MGFQTIGPRFVSKNNLFDIGCKCNNIRVAVFFIINSHMDALYVKYSMLATGEIV